MRGLISLAVVSVIAGSLALAGSPSASAELPLQPLIDAAEPGSTLVLEAGTYLGGVVVDKPLTITATDLVIIDGHNVGSVFTIEAPDVTIENLTISNSGDSLDREDSGITSIGVPRVTIRNNILENTLFGVFLRTAPDSFVVGNIVGSKNVEVARRGDGIRLWECEGAVVDSNTVTGGRDLVFWFANGIVVTNNTVNHGRYGLHFMYSDDAVIQGNNLSDNSVGAFLMYSRRTQIIGNVMANNYGPSGYGVGLKDMDDVRIEDNRFISNRIGVYIDNSPWSADSQGWVEGNLFAYNRVGMLFQPSVKRNHVSMNTFIDNTEQVGITGSGDFVGNNWSVDGVGNYWSDFAGYDADGNGIGDVTYRGQDLYNSLTDGNPELTFFQETPAAKAISLAAQMFPILRPKPVIEDAFPLVDRPVLVPLTISAQGSSTRALALISALMVMAGGAAVAFPSRRRRPTFAGEAKT